MSMDQVQILRAACCVAGIDEHVNDRERELLERIAEHVGVGRASLRAMIDRAQSESDYYEEQLHLVRGDPDQAMKVLLSLAVTDKDVSADERIILRHFAGVLGMEGARFDQLLAAAERHAAK